MFWVDHCIEPMVDQDYGMAAEVTRMKRHKNALAIHEGACNLRAIARSLVEAADEAAGEGGGAEQDVAVRLIVLRLARLCKVEEMLFGYDAITLTDSFCTLMNQCKTRATEGDAVRVETAVHIPQADSLADLLASVQLDRETSQA